MATLRLGVDHRHPGPERARCSTSPPVPPLDAPPGRGRARALRRRDQAGAADVLGAPPRRASASTSWRARAVEVEREPREVVVHAIALECRRAARVRCACAAGRGRTCARSRPIWARARLRRRRSPRLVRTRVGPFALEDAVAGPRCATGAGGAALWAAGPAAGLGAGRLSRRSRLDAARSARVRPRPGRDRARPRRRGSCASTAPTARCSGSVTSARRPRCSPCECSMQIVRGLDSFPPELPPVASSRSAPSTASTSRHARILGTAVERGARPGVPALACTFDPHPDRGPSADRAPRADHDRSRRTSRCIAEHRRSTPPLVIPFTQELSRVEAEAFVQDVLVGTLGAREVVVGFNHRFGAARAAPRRCSRSWAVSAGLHDPRAAPPRNWSGRPSRPARFGRRCVTATSSSTRALLGRPYRVSGTVLRGAGRGRTLGFPPRTSGRPAARCLPPGCTRPEPPWETRGPMRLSTSDTGRPSASSSTGSRPTVRFLGRLYDVRLTRRLPAADPAGDEVPGVDALQARRSPWTWRRPGGCSARTAADGKVRRGLLCPPPPRSDMLQMKRNATGEPGRTRHHEIEASCGRARGDDGRLRGARAHRPRGRRTGRRARVEYDPPPGCRCRQRRWPWAKLPKLIGAKVGFTVPPRGRRGRARVTVSIVSASVDDALRQLLRGGKPHDPVPEGTRMRRWWSIGSSCWAPRPRAYRWRTPGRARRTRRRPGRPRPTRGRQRRRLWRGRLPPRAAPFPCRPAREKARRRKSSRSRWVTCSGRMRWPAFPRRPGPPLSRPRRPCRRASRRASRSRRSGRSRV